MQVFLVLLILLGPPLAAQDKGLAGIGIIECIENTLETNPALEISRHGVAYQRAVLQAASGQFDILLSSSASVTQSSFPLLASQRSENLTHFDSEETSYGVGISRQFRSGFALSATAGLTRLYDQSANRTTPNYSSLSFSAAIPLMRGRGSAATGAGERAATVNLGAGEEDLEHDYSRRAWFTILTYWGYRAAQEQLEILLQSEKRSRAILEETKILIEAGERPAAEMQQLQANLADKISSRILREQALLEARHNLGLAIGLNIGELSALPPAGDRFPVAAETGTFNVENQNLYAERALRKRGDYQASQARQQAAQILREAAVSNSRVKLDLNFNLGYNGLVEGSNPNAFFRPFGENLSGLNTTASLIFTLPTDVDHGIVLQQHELYEQSVLYTDELSRSIRSEIIVAVEELQRNIERYHKTKEAIDLYSGSLENEEQKMQLGLSTIIDVIFIEDRLTSARLNWVSAQMNYANALATLKYHSGDLLHQVNGRAVVSYEDITRIPQP